MTVDLFATLETVFISFSILSAIASFTVILTAIVFPQMRERVFMQIIIMTAFCDFIASIASSFGFPPNYSPLCPAQSFLNQFFYKASWFWTVILTYQLYGVVMYGTLQLRTLTMHVLCWSVALICTLVPLSTTTFGRDDDGEALAWCYLKGKDTNTLVVVVLSLYIPLFISIALMCYFSIRIYWKYRNVDLRAANPDIYSIVDTLRLFPLAMIFNWGPNLVVSVLANTSQISSSEDFVIIFNAVTILATQNGTFSALIFFYKSKEAQFRWKQFFNREDDLQRPSQIPTDFAKETSYSEHHDRSETCDENDYIRYSDTVRDIGLRSVASSGEFYNMDLSLLFSYSDAIYSYSGTYLFIFYRISISGFA